MEHNEEDDDLKLAKASAGLLADLESCLPKVLWKPSRTDAGRGRVHSYVRRTDLDYITNLIEPFQSEPHLLDAKLKTLLPPIVDAYLESLLKPATRPSERHIDVQTALATVLYTLCKVRGAKVIVGFLNNEPRYLEPILSTLENVNLEENTDTVDWKVPYVLLLWLSHLLLTPFDLASISANSLPEGSAPMRLHIHNALPPVAQRIVHLCTKYLSASTKAQDAAAAVLVRLATRPDMQTLQVADALFKHAASEISSPIESSTTIYRQLGPLRFLAGVASSADVSHLMPLIYRTCTRLSEDDGSSPVTSNAVGKKLIVKIYRNIAILTLRLPSASGPVLSFLETTSVLEEVIDHLLQSLGDRDTPVRYAAAKAISLIISELEPEMGHEVIQAVLDTFKEDIPRSTKGIDYQTVNALKWHGLTLTLSHALFKRSASPSQLPDILNALVSALNFEQRTATGSSMGTNVRDAANFGIWSLSRRYTSDELLSVDTNDVRLASSTSTQTTVIQAMAVQLLLSACLDPAGNIRRGSSAALQELIGRHPNQVVEGISVVQIVDYQAVGLRKRGLIDVAGKAASLDYTYWEALVDGLIAWRGLRSVDVTSREAAAFSLANLVSIRKKEDSLTFVAERLLNSLESSSSSDIETMHGLVCSLSNLLDLSTGNFAREAVSTLHRRFWLAVQSRGVSRVDFNPRSLKSELPVAMARLVTSVCRVEAGNSEDNQDFEDFEDMENFVQRLLTRHEDPILQVVPDMVKQLANLQKCSSKPMECIAVETLSWAVAADGSKAVLAGAGRAIALGTVALRYDDERQSDAADFAISTIANLVTVRNVDWRIIGLRALHLALEGLDTLVKPSLQNTATIVQAIHSGLTDYTIDERGDIGSLVRLQGLTCVSRLLSTAILGEDTESCQLLQSDVLRLSLEKLDRVRARAAECRQTRLPTHFSVEDSSNTTSQAYLSSALAPIFQPDRHHQPWALRALVEGAISCAGISAESLLQTSRHILTTSLHAADVRHVQVLFTVYSEVLRDSVVASTATQQKAASVLVLPALDLLAFFLDMRVLQRLAEDPRTTASFKWRSLLSSVQKSHHKSSDVVKLLAAVSVYRGLAGVESIRGEVVKKLLSMLATNPYPRIRVAVAEVVFEVLGVEEMKAVNWAEKGVTQVKMVADFRKRFVESV